MAVMLQRKTSSLSDTNSERERHKTIGFNEHHNSLNCEKAGTSKGLWGRRVDMAPTNKCIFRRLLGVTYLLLNSFHLKSIPCTTDCR